MAGEPRAERRETRAESRTQEQRGRPERPAGEDEGGRRDAVVARRPLRRRALPAGALLAHAHDHGALLDANRFGARHHLHAVPLRVRQLDAIGALLGTVRTPQIAQSRPAASLEVDGELLGAEAERPAAAHEEVVVLVDELGRQDVDVGLRHELPRATLDLVRREAGNAPPLDHARRRDERHAGVDHRGPTVERAEGQRHRAVGGEEAAAILVQRARHVELAAGELVIGEARALLEHEDALAVAHERAERLRHRPAPGARADDDDVVALLDHRRASHPRALAR